MLPIKVSNFLGAPDANTPMIVFLIFTALYNPACSGWLRELNFLVCLTIGSGFFLSSGMMKDFKEQALGPQIGIASALAFCAAPRFRLLYTNRFFSRRVHDGIGAAYVAYHSVQWYRTTHTFEDAMEDTDDDW